MGIYIQSDKYFNNQKRYSMYGDVCPVDINAGLVVEKCGKAGMCKENGKQMQHNIQERFCLESPNGGESYE